MNLKSIKWRLQLWYGLILVAVLAGFGLTSFQLERNRQYRRVDEELHRRLSTLAQSLHGPPRGPRQGRPPDDFGPGPEFPNSDGPGDPRALPHFRLTPQAAALFGSDGPGDYYFWIGRLNDRGAVVEIGKSENFRHALPQPDNWDQAYVPQNPRKDLPNKRERLPPSNVEDDRFIQDILPSGELILVGASIAREQRELRLAALKLAGFGGIILLVGLAGGWWFVRRALRPIAEISATATKIASGDLSQRINASETESELGQLAAVLNSTFARLDTAFAQQKQFASDAAHELRTPVSVILTQTQMALARERDAAGYKQTVEACQRAAQRMRRLIESLLELARFDAGQEVLKHLRFDLATIVSDSVDLVQPLAEQKNVKVISELTAQEITGDSERLGQVVTNLLTNAIQYNKPAGEVRVRLSAGNGLTILEIADSGLGIKPEDLPRIFERFYRADKSRTGSGNTGLGLSICRAIVEAHGGTIDAASAPGNGSVFTVRLPSGVAATPPSQSVSATPRRGE
ncbi:MAG TPA: ATP-binding protein [Verrucomicrobiae bacterium]